MSLCAYLHTLVPRFAAQACSHSQPRRGLVGQLGRWFKVCPVFIHPDPWWKMAMSLPEDLMFGEKALADPNDLLGCNPLVLYSPLSCFSFNCMLSLPGKPGWQWEVAEFKWAHATDPSTCGLDTRCIPIRKYFIGSPHATGVYIYICICVCVGVCGCVRVDIYRL